MATREPHLHQCAAAPLRRPLPVRLRAHCRDVMTVNKGRGRGSPGSQTVTHTLSLFLAAPAGILLVPTRDGQHMTAAFGDTVNSFSTLLFVVPTRRKSNIHRKRLGHLEKSVYSEAREEHGDSHKRPD